MKLEKAYSIETETKITASQADILCGEGVISSKFLFKCPDENCDAQVTCANLTRPKRLRKRDPYFKIVSPHSHGCQVKKDINNSKKKRKFICDGIYGVEDEYLEDAVRLNLHPPSNKRLSKSGNTASGNNEVYYQVNRVAENEGGKRKIQHSKTLGSMIDSFLNGENFVVQIPVIGHINLRDLFIEIDNQDINILPDEFRVYYGAAWINRLKNHEDYQIRFANKLSCNGIESPPTIFIPKSLIEGSSFARFNEQNFKKLVTKTPKKVFILSKSAPFLKLKKFINIWLEGLEYIEYRNM